jgi:hypothetical protein
MKKIIVFFITLLFLPLIHAGVTDTTHLIISDYGEYCHISLPDEAGSLYLYDDGSPVLPYTTKIYAFPPGTEIREVTIKPKNYESISLPKKIMPTPPAYSLTNGTRDLPTQEGSLYTNDSFYPSTYSTHTLGMGIYGGKRQLFLSIHLFPIQYNPVRNMVRYIPDFDITIDYELPNMAAQTNDSPGLLIITPEEWKGTLENLKQEKDGNGIDTHIVSLTEIFEKQYVLSEEKNEDISQIKYFIKDAIEKWGIQSVLLVGDADILPVPYVNTSIGLVPSDLYYADIYHGNGSYSSWDRDKDGYYGERREDKPDIFPDVHIARLPASTEQELQILLDKIQGYETPPLRSILVGTELAWDTEEPEGEYIKEEICNQINMDSIKLYETDYYQRDYPATATSISNALNEGGLFVNFAAHGYPHGMGWESGSFGSSNVDSLTNSYLPIVFALSCSTNRFDDTDCIGEKFLLNSNGGAIAYVGSTRVAYVYLGTGIKSALSGYLDKAFFSAYYDGGRTIGELFTTAKLDYLITHPFINAHDYLTLVQYNLLGDPSLTLPVMPLTSRASVSRENSNEKISITANITQVDTDITIDLYYRKKIFYGGRWTYYESCDKKPYTWQFLPENEGNYEFYTQLKTSNYTEKPPSIPDTSCIFDFTPPSVEIQQPNKGEIYIFNRRVAISNWIDFAIVLGKIKVEVDGDISQAHFYWDNQLVHVDETAPFYWIEKRPSRGFHTIKIIGYDAAGNSAEAITKIFTLGSQIFS